MLGNLHARRRQNQGCRRGNVEGVGAVAARAHNLEYFHAGMLNGRCQLAHGCGTATDLVDGLRLGALGGKRRKKRGILRGRRLAGHNLAHYGVGLIEGEVTLHDNLLDGFLDHGFCSPLFPVRRTRFLAER